MMVNKGKMKYYTKYKVYATSILDVKAQNKVISEFLVLKMHLCNTVETWNFTRMLMAMTLSTVPNFKLIQQIFERLELKIGWI